MTIKLKMQMVLGATALMTAGAANAAAIFISNSTVSASPDYTVVQNFNVGGSAPSTGPGAPANATGYAGMSGTYSVCAGAGIPNNCIFQVAPVYTSPFLAVLGGNTATYTLANAATGVAFDWGTVSSDNKVTVNFVGGISQDYTVSSAMPGTPGYNGNGVFIETGGAGPLIQSITFTTPNNAFEIDNIAVKGAVPEPATWAMMVLGFGVVGSSMRRRAKKTIVSFV